MAKTDFESGPEGTRTVKALAKMTKHELAAYIDEQAIPFIRINEKCVAAGRPPQFANPRLEAIRYQLVKTPSGGIRKVERKEPLLSEVQGEVCSKWLSEGRQTHTEGERKLSTTKRGKYNDAEFLELTMPCTVERGEIDGGSGFSVGL